jgi:hypothetical protein
LVFVEVVCICVFVQLQTVGVKLEALTPADI